MAELETIELYGGPLDGATRRVPSTDAAYTEYCEGIAALYRRANTARHDAQIFGYVTKDGRRCTKLEGGRRCTLSHEHHGGCAFGPPDVGGAPVD